MAQDQTLTSAIIFSLIDKLNFELISRLKGEMYECTLSPRTPKLAKICLPIGNLDFVQFLRYFSSQYVIQLRRKALNLKQNQDFNLEKILWQTSKIF